MQRPLILASALVLLCAGPGHAQVPGDSPPQGIGAAVSNSRSKPLLGMSKKMEYEHTGYSTSVPPPPRGKSKPKPKPQSDPWAGMRDTSTSVSEDRYRPY